MLITLITAFTESSQPQYYHRKQSVINPRACRECNELTFIFDTRPPAAHKNTYPQQDSDDHDATNDTPCKETRRSPGGQAIVLWRLQLLLLLLSEQDPFSPAMQPEPHVAPADFTTAVAAGIDVAGACVGACAIMSGPNSGDGRVPSKMLTLSGGLASSFLLTCHCCSCIKAPAGQDIAMAYCGCHSPPVSEPCL